VQDLYKKYLILSKYFLRKVYYKMPINHKLREIIKKIYRKYNNNKIYNCNNFIDANLQCNIEASLRNSPIFSAKDYFSHNKDLDVKKVDPFFHASKYGINENRLRFSENLINKFIKKNKNNQSFFIQNCKKNLKGSNFIIFVSLKYNFYMVELANALKNDLLSFGANVVIENSFNSNITLINKKIIIVAPHEFFLDIQEVKYFNSKKIKIYYVLNTEQPQTTWYGLAYKFMIGSSGVLDLFYENVLINKKIGLNTTLYIPSGKKNWDYNYQQFKFFKHPLIASYSDLVNLKKHHNPISSKRPLDIVFFGKKSDKRDIFFSKNAKFLSKYRCLINYLEPSNSLNYSNYENEEFLTAFLCRHSKIYLNISRDELGFFISQRFLMQAMANGITVVSDKLFDHFLFKNNEHFLSYKSNEISEALKWLLTSKDGILKRKEVGVTGFKYYSNFSMIKNNFLKNSLLKFFEL